jgi:hypothetical protein
VASGGWLEVRRDPTGLFARGARFRRFDFVESLEGAVWAAGMELVDEAARKYVVAYLPLPGLVRDDGERLTLRRSHGRSRLQLETKEAA